MVSGSSPLPSPGACPRQQYVPTEIRARSFLVALGLGTGLSIWRGGYRWCCVAALIGRCVGTWRFSRLASHSFAGSPWRPRGTVGYLSVLCVMAWAFDDCMSPMPQFLLVGLPPLEMSGLSLSHVCFAVVFDRLVCPLRGVFPLRWSSDLKLIDMYMDWSSLGPMISRAAPSFWSPPRLMG